MSNSVNQFTTKFNRTLKGYSIEEVNSFINNLIAENEKLKNELTKCKELLEDYTNQEKYIKSALVTAEQTASQIKLNAQNEAKQIIEKAEKERQELIDKTVEETSQFKENIYKYFYGYEHDLRLILNNFYSKARNHIERLEKDFCKDIEDVIIKYENNYPKNFDYNQQCDVNTEENIKLDSIEDRWDKIDTSLFLGKQLKKNLCDASGNIIVEKNSILTPRLIENIIDKGLYGELLLALTSIEDNDEE
ncbi:hypothetical protein Q428_01010 [Fervidicella metallireducens AeB]|uniref:Cell division protein DivIVA n=1 Tax=Fervidicella metallireducens AeB TaxID=1403537 RepID=A0A017RZ82_9CLOT|nr:DivIVA domain-containing protein [Fervidicella metallireducens]EYE89714.1 hypothetical protein Q428_01010 [Fervidicella metallireducens AeB]